MQRLKPGVVTLPASASFNPSCIFIVAALLSFLSMLKGNGYWHEGGSREHSPIWPAWPSPCIRRLFPLCGEMDDWEREGACIILPHFPTHLRWRLRLPLMYLNATTKRVAAEWVGDHSIRWLGCCCKYSNEPSWLDGVSDNGFIFYLPLLMCDGGTSPVVRVILPPPSEKCHTHTAGINPALPARPPSEARGALFIYPFVISIVIFMAAVY